MEYIFAAHGSQKVIFLLHLSKDFREPNMATKIIEDNQNYID